MKNILSIDGGGVRTLMPLTLLNEIEKRTGVSISELFDYFAGVSAGALICSLLLLKDENGKQKYKTADIIDIFESQCKIIFSYTYLGWIKTGFGLFDSSYSSANIIKSFDNYFTDVKITDLIKPITIISYDLITNKPIYFNVSRYPSITIKDCLIATTAAPTYFSPHNLIINDVKHMLIDGGVVTNNPIEQCFLDAYDYFEINKQKNNLVNEDSKNDSFYTLSLGTGYLEVDYTTGNYGKLGWSSKIIDILFNANIFDHNCQLKLIDKMMPNNKLHRINFKLNKNINLDNVYSFSEMKTIMDNWVTQNNELINILCSELLYNYNNSVNNIKETVSNNNDENN